MVQPGDQHIRLADVVHRSVLADLEREDFSAFETGAQPGIPRQFGMRGGKRLELGERLLVAMELSVRQRDADPAGWRRFRPAARVEALTREQSWRSIGKLLRSV